MLIAAIRTHPNEPIVIVSSFFNDQAACYHRIVFFGLMFHPLHGGSTHFFGELFSIHRETGIEHFR